MNKTGTINANHTNKNNTRREYYYRQLNPKFDALVEMDQFPERHKLSKLTQLIHNLNTHIRRRKMILLVIIKLLMKTQEQKASLVNFTKHLMKN